MVVDNDISASRHSRKERPGFTAVQAKLAGDDPVDILWAWESSRVTRDLEVYAQVRSLCERYGVLWSYHGRTYDMSNTSDRFTTGLDALVAERYADETRDRVLRAVRSRMERGLPHGRLPFGYRSIYDEHTGIAIRREPDPATAWVVKEIARRLLAGEASNAIANDFNARRIPTPAQVVAQRRGAPAPAGARWTIEAVRRIGSNATYAGLREHGGKVVGEANWPPIISTEEHLRLRELLRDPRRNTRPDSARTKHLLSGIALCGVCGSPCRRVMNRGYPTYSCYGGLGTVCVVRAQAAVDDRVTRAILRRLREPDAVDLFTAATPDADVAAAKTELAKLEARLEAFRAAAEDPDGLPPETLARMEARYRPLIEAARARTVARHVPEPVRDLVLAPDAQQHWDDVMSIQQKRRVVRYLVTVRIMPSGLPRGMKGFDPTSVAVDWNDLS